MRKPLNRDLMIPNVKEVSMGKGIKAVFITCAYCDICLPRKWIFCPFCGSRIVWATGLLDKED